MEQDFAWGKRGQCRNICPHWPGPFSDPSASQSCCNISSGKGSVLRGSASKVLESNFLLILRHSFLHLCQPRPLASLVQTLMARSDPSWAGPHSPTPTCLQEALCQEHVNPFENHQHHLVAKTKIAPPLVLSSLLFFFQNFFEKKNAHIHKSWKNTKINISMLLSNTSQLLMFCHDGFSAFHMCLYAKPFKSKL